MPLHLRAATPDDHNTLWSMLEPVFRAGDTYAVDPDIPRDDALAYWTADHVYIAADSGTPLGTYYIRPNQKGGGSHVCNCGYITARGAEGRGVARAMLAHSLDEARRLGFEAMQFNFVLASNTRAVETWRKAGFDTIGRIPRAFRTPGGGETDALVMHRFLA